MKKLLFIFSMMLALTVYSSLAYADDVLVSFNVSSAGTVSGTGFGLSTVPSNGRIILTEVGQEEYALLLQKDDDTVSGGICVYNVTWSSPDVDHLILTTRIKTDETEGGRKGITLRMKEIPHCEALAIDGSTFYCCGKAVDSINAEAGHWYDIKIALKKNPSYMVDLYIDGEKAASVPFENLKNMTSSGLQLRMELAGAGTLYIGDTRLYVPTAPKAQVQNPQLEEADEAVQIKLISGETDMSSVISGNIRVVDDLSGEEVNTEAEREGDMLKLTFPDGIRSDNSYTVDLDKVTDISGQSFGSVKFNTKKPEKEYITGAPQLYSGLGYGEKLDSLKKGDMTVVYPVENGGLQKREAVLVCALYQDGKLASLSTAGVALAAEEKTELMTSVKADTVDSGTQLWVMLWKGFGGAPAAEEYIFR